MDLTDPRVKKAVAKLITEWTLGTGLLREVEGSDPNGTGGTTSRGPKGKNRVSLKSRLSPVMMITGNMASRSSPVINF